MLNPLPSFADANMDSLFEGITDEGDESRHYLWTGKA